MAINPALLALGGANIGVLPLAFTSHGSAPGEPLDWVEVPVDVQSQRLRDAEEVYGPIATGAVALILGFTVGYCLAPFF